MVVPFKVLIRKPSFKIMDNTIKSEIKLSKEVRYYSFLYITIIYYAFERIHTHIYQNAKKIIMSSIDPISFNCQLICKK